MSDLLKKYLLSTAALRSPDDDIAAADPAAPADDGGAPADGDEGSDATSERRSVREELEAQFDAARTNDEGDSERPDRDGKGRFAPRGAKDGDAAAPDAAAAAPADGEAPVETAQAAATEAQAPKGWSKEAQAEWAKLPPTVQSAVAKREKDVAAGVEKLRKNYSDLDQALAPHLDVIRSNKHTPASAVHSMFQWFQALHTNPDVAFPALMKSYGIDPTRFAGGEKPAADPAAGKDAAATAAAADKGVDVNELSPAALKMFNDMRTEIMGLKQGVESKFGGIEGALGAIQQKDTEAFVNLWAKNKPHFEELRGTMAKLIQSGMVAPKEDGTVDLDAAYEQAVWMVPEVRDAVAAAKQKAATTSREQEKQKRQLAELSNTQRARKTATSLAPSAPGAPAPEKDRRRPGERKTVRQSLEEAMRQVNDSAA